MPTAPRRLSLGDLAAFVVAAAIGLTVTRFMFRNLPSFRDEIAAGRPQRVAWLCWIYTTILAITLLLLRLKRPRPRMARLVLQPGFVACFAIAIGYLYEVSWELVTFRNPTRWVGFEVSNVFLSPMSAQQTSGGIVVAWLLLILGKRWRAEPGWIDRSGRVLGVWWIGSSLVTHILLMLGRM